MKLLVTGTNGQVARALAAIGQSQTELDILLVGRPHFDLLDDRDPTELFGSLKPDVIVNAAAYTAVDLAEQEPELAYQANAVGAGRVARAAARLGKPLIQLSTDYVFPGDLDRPYREGDPVGPQGSYGKSKLAGELAVAAATDDYAILRTAWVYAAEGKNFVRTMLRLASTRDEVAVVADQIGNPTFASDIASGVIRVAENLLRDPNRPDLRGIFHMTAKGEASWAGFAKAIFREAAHHGLPAASVRDITTDGYPTPARRPANSRLNCDKIASHHGVVLPAWQDGMSRCIAQIKDSGETFR